MHHHPIDDSIQILSRVDMCRRELKQIYSIGSRIRSVPPISRIDTGPTHQAEITTTRDRCVVYWLRLLGRPMGATTVSHYIN